jgi:chitin disaccharide deacetylase
MRYLIVNADDFGQSHGINRGVKRSHEEGIVTSCSLMVRHPAAGDAASYSREHRTLAVGLHVDVGEWTWRNNEWIPIYSVLPTDDSAAIHDEI